MKNTFHNADEAYEALLDEVIINGIEFDGTQAIFNCGFYITNPEDNHITNKQRNWSLEYAEAEWQWYLSGDPSIDKLGELYGKIPPIWERMANSDREVNSNYGYQWKRKAQIDYVCAKLKTILIHVTQQLVYTTAKNMINTRKTHLVLMQFSLLL